MHVIAQQKNIEAKSHTILLWSKNNEGVEQHLSSEQNNAREIYSINRWKLCCTVFKLAKIYG